MNYTTRDSYRQSNNVDEDIMPYKEITEFKTDSSDLDVGVTMLKFDKDDKYEYITYFNGKGVVGKFKRKIKKNEQ